MKSDEINKMNGSDEIDEINGSDEVDERENILLLINF